MFDLIENNLFKIQKPGRYIGNELGIPKKDFINSKVKFVICYPDIYEIGMSNLGIKIIYDRINKMEFSTCERVFSPWIDMEAFLRNNKFPLFSLESKTPLYEFDFIGFSIQYELLFSNFLNVLDLGHVEIFSEKRNNNLPIIICGGPGIVNPTPYKPFVDLFLIGEAEEVIEKLIYKYYLLKKNNISRNDIIKELSEIDGIYSPVYSNNKQIKRQIYNNFHIDKGLDIYLTPLIDIVQNKHVVEIMRGCPNKCRFCQAGIIYKPYREKNINIIMQNIEDGLNNLGINEVTLSSLSSGDYSQIIDLTENFINLYKERHISFSLPSIKVESFDIDLLDRLSIVRKSGLTFAIESGSIEGQLSINKQVLFEKIKNIILYGITKGWRHIKLYFMIGLPHIKNEKESIIQFISDLLKINKKIKLNINLTVFVPKPHTPYQNENQLSLEDSIEIINFIQNYFKKSRAKIKSHNPYMSFLEGIISRGDENIGLAIYEAFKNGARFDGWDDRFDFKIYQDAFNKTNLSYNKYLVKNNDNYFWENIDVGLDKKYFFDENQKSQNNLLTKNCKEECDEYCYVCKSNSKKINSIKEEYKISVTDKKQEKKEINKTKVFLEFSKINLARFIGHIDIIKYFERLFNLSKIDITFTEGFNPHPKMQFSSPLPLGIESNCEILELKTNICYDEDTLLKKLKEYEHPEIQINRIKNILNSEKKSISNCLYITKYCAIFDKLYYNQVYNIINVFKNSKTIYTLIKNNVPIEGYYQEFLNLYNLEDDRIYFDVKNINYIPKILESIAFIMNNIPVKVKKIKMMTFINENLVDLFDLFDNR